MGTISNLLSLLCFIALLGHRGADRDLLENKTTNDQRSNYQISYGQVSNQLNIQKTNQLNPDQLLNIARSQIGVREATGNNDGYQVEQYLAYTGNKKGEAWCASFVSWVFGKAGYAAPRTAWSPSLFPQVRLVKLAEPGNVFGIYFNDKKRIAHAGIVEKVKDTWITTIEGNTDTDGRRDGDGVYRKLRHAKPLDVMQIGSIGKEVQDESSYLCMGVIVLWLFR
ncbi:CHAP domain-containing protein [Pedobacter ureilyticus]|uniref:CHAP domain-containing protein n=1 Tax=Pedobacter ureilyticus TaxID=1393051 RepID=A0ABW9J581_9SPHI|nr:CHAP domain-containing protein [Pedobacter helvus]